MGERAGREVARARQGRASRLCNRVAHMKDATSEEVLALINSPHQDNLLVQPVAQRLGVERLKEPVAPACGGTPKVSMRVFISGLVIQDRSQGRLR